MTPASQMLRSLFNETLQQLDIGQSVARLIEYQGGDLIVCGQRYRLTTIEQIIVVAVGKAATPMYEAAAEAFENSLERPPRTTFLLVSPTPPLTVRPHLTFFPGSHPTPDEVSRAAANAVFDCLKTADDRTFVLFLISGGASSMIEAPLDPKISIDDTAAFHRALVASGLPIAEMNVLRKHFSLVKGGRLAGAATHAAAQCTLIVSDVPEHAVASVGSGLSLPDESTVAESLRILESFQERVAVPERVLAFFHGPLLQETPKTGDAMFARSFHRVILSSVDLAEAATRLARHAGFHVEVDSTCDDWDYADAAHYLLDRARSLIHPRSCLISVGEIAVRIGRPPGRGGRNQHFALACALLLEQQHTRLTVLSAGSDGVDGNSAAAGALADGTTCERARRLNIDAQQSLDNFDSFALFDALGDTLVTGPTGNNLRDLRIFLSN